MKNEIDGSMAPVLVLDLGQSGLAVGRSLAKRGVQVYGACINSMSVARFSKNIRKPSFGYRVTADDSLLKHMIEFAEQSPVKPVLLPSSDAFIGFVSEHYSTLRRFYHMQDSLAPEISRKFLNKSEFYRLCEDHNMAYPKTLSLTGTEPIKRMAVQLKLPLILKPNYIHKWKQHLKGNKVLYIKSQEELDTVLKHEKHMLADSVLQEVIPGPENHIFFFKGYFGRDFKIKASFTGRKIRQYPPFFGTATVAEALISEEVNRLSVEFLEKVKFHGICGTEFKYDARDNTFKMIEINIRPETFDDLSRVAGIDVIWLAYCDLAGYELPIYGRQSEKAKWSDLAKDIYSSLLQLKKGEMSFSEWAKSYDGISCDVLFDPHDLSLLLGYPLSLAAALYRNKIRTSSKTLADK